MTEHDHPSTQETPFRLQEDIDRQGWITFIDVVLPDGSLENFGPLPQGLKFTTFGHGPLYYSEHPDFSECMVFSNHVFAYDPTRISVEEHEHIDPADLKVKIDEFRRQKYGVAAGTFSDSRQIEERGGRRKTETFEVGKIVTFRPI